MTQPRTPRLRAALDARLAVREAVATLPAGSAVLVALSGGSDSLSLAAAAVYEGRATGVRVGAVVVDHGLQEGSARVTAEAAQHARALGLDPVLTRRVTVEESGSGIEAAAREARYLAIAEAARHTGAAVVLTGHTRDDQAEQVLLALTRGSGVRSLAGIPSERDMNGVRILRPYLSERVTITRRTTEDACVELGLTPWQDPHNIDPAFTRVRVREHVLPLLEQHLGPGVAAALARTASLAREDADALDTLAAEAMLEAVTSVRNETHLSVASLRPLPAALRNRVIRHLARERFETTLTRERTLAIAALVMEWRGQGPIEAPGFSVVRRGEVLVFTRS